MLTPEERYANQRECEKALRALRICRRRCVVCNVCLPREAHRQTCETCAPKRNAARRACYARKHQGAPL